MATRARRLLRLTRLVIASALLVFAVGFVGIHTRSASAQGIKQAGWLGVAMEKSKGVPGVIVTHVIRLSPAAKAGLLDGDRIVKVDGSAVAAPGEVSAKVSSKGAGAIVAIDVTRSGTAVSATITLAPRPSADQIFRMELVGLKAPALPVLKLASGPGPVAYPALSGRVVLVDLFATWCGPCLQLGPYYHAFHSKYAAQGLVVLAISAEDPVILAKWSSQNGVGYTVASDPSDSVFSRFTAPALPSSVLIDKHGVVRDVAVGFELGQVKRTEQLIQALLKEP